MNAASIKPQSSSRGFTLVEILVTIGIIVILISIVIPVVTRVRKQAQSASAQAQLNSLVDVIHQYQQDFGALPGPLTYDQIACPTVALVAHITPFLAPNYNTALNTQKITMAENLVLGLAGGLRLNPVNSSPAGSPPSMLYDPLLVGNGANSLNPASPKKYRSYIDQKDLSWREENGKTGQYQDGAGAADDSIIPEILDTFASRMPILYLRARKGQQNTTAPNAWTPIDNLVITDGTTTIANRIGQYDLSQIVGYVGTAATPTTIGEGKSIDVNSYTGTKPAPSALRHGLLATTPGATPASMDKASPQYVYPYDAYPYFKNPSSTENAPQPREKDGFILISAGLDRVYGTSDDIASFGPVNP